MATLDKKITKNTKNVMEFLDFTQISSIKYVKMIVIFYYMKLVEIGFFKGLGRFFKTSYF